MIIRKLQSQDLQILLTITNELPEWFTKIARHEFIPTDLRHQEGFVAVNGSEPIGFITLYVAEGRLNIGWLGVRKACQRQGTGTLLLRRAEERARELGIRELATCTLGESVDYVPYKQTRKFYFKNGFTVYQRSKTDNPEFPEELRIKKLVTQPSSETAAVLLHRSI